jgi:hypothetical protein
LRCLQVLFGLSLSQRRFYIFMASSKLPWPRLWTTLWSLIPNPTTEVRYADFHGVRSFIKWKHEMEDGDGITPYTI